MNLRKIYQLAESAASGSAVRVNFDGVDYPVISIHQGANDVIIVGVDFEDPQSVSQYRVESFLAEIDEHHYCKMFPVLLRVFSSGRSQDHQIIGAAVFWADDADENALVMFCRKSR